MTEKPATQRQLAELQRQYAQTAIRDLIERAYEAGVSRATIGKASDKPTADEVNKAIEALEATAVAVFATKEVDNAYAELAAHVISEAEAVEPMPGPPPVPPPQVYTPDFEPRAGAIRATVEGQVFHANPGDPLFALVSMFAGEFWNGAAWESCTLDIVDLGSVTKNTKGGTTTGND